MPKAQIGTEFMIFVGIAFLIALTFQLLSLGHLKDFGTQRENDAVKDLGLKIQRELLIAATVEDGYIREFDIPQKLDQINFTIINQNSTVVIESKKAFFIARIPESTGNLTKGTNTLNKIGGVININ